MKDIPIKLGKYAPASKDFKSQAVWSEKLLI